MGRGLPRSQPGPLEQANRDLPSAVKADLATLARAVHRLVAKGVTTPKEVEGEGPFGDLEHALGQIAYVRNRLAGKYEEQLGQVGKRDNTVDDWGFSRQFILAEIAETLQDEFKLERTISTLGHNLTEVGRFPTKRSSSKGLREALVDALQQVMDGRFEDVNALFEKELEDRLGPAESIGRPHFYRHLVPDLTTEDRGWPDTNPPEPRRQATAFEEIQRRLRRPERYDQYSLSAHNLDKVYRVESLEADHEEAVGPPQMAAGGSGANTAFALARLGFAVSVGGIVVDDEDGRLLRRSLGEAKADLTTLAVLASGQGQVTGHALVLAQNKRRSIFVRPGANEVLAATLEKSGGIDAIRAHAHDARLVHLSSFTAPAERHLQERLILALPEERVVSITPGALYARVGLTPLKALLCRANLIFLYENQLQALVDPSKTLDGSYRLQLDRLFRWRWDNGSRQPLIVLLKRHSPRDAGVYRQIEYVVIAAGREEVEEEEKPENVFPGYLEEDPTGAGDAMAAGVHAALLWGAESLTQCVDVALVMGLEAAGSIGARAGLPDRAGLRAGWRRHFGTAGPRLLSEK